MILPDLGLAPATAAASAYFLELNIAAHSSLVTTDIPVSLAILLTIAAFWSVSRKLSWPRLAALTLALFAALTTKYSGVLVVPALVVLAILAAGYGPDIARSLSPRRLLGSAPLRSFPARLAGLLASLVAAGLARISHR